jgi:hypothetical protein
MKKTGFFQKLHLDDFVESQVLYMMKGPLILYALNMSGQLLIDLAGLLERYAIIYIEELFKSLRSIQLFPAALCVIEEMMEKRFLNELAKHLVTLEIWDKEDIRQVNKLYEKRNLVAHKNTKKIEAILNIGTAISVPEIDLAISIHFDVLPYVFITIRLLSKLIARSVEKLERYRVAQAIMDNRVSNEAEFFSMNF